MTQQIDLLVPNQEALNSARDGDFTALNKWGTDAQSNVAKVGAQFQSVLDAAPDDDLAEDMTAAGNILATTEQEHCT